jgi:hypothetical protein
MTAADILRRIVAKLEAAGIPCMVTGSFASTFHGAPRTTHDIDLVIDPTGAALVQFIASLPDAEYYVDLDVARDALRRRSLFNVIDLATGWKVDLIIRKARPFSEAEFTRRQPAELLGVPVSVASLEDIIIAKLEWAKLASSERQLQDVAALLAVHGSRLDVAHIEHWVTDLQLQDEWSRARALPQAAP